MWFSVQRMNKTERLDPDFDITYYWIGRMQNEMIFEASNHEGTPLKMFSKLFAYAQLEENNTQHFQSEYQHSVINDMVSWFQFATFQEKNYEFYSVLEFRQNYLNSKGYAFYEEFSLSKN